MNFSESDRSVPSSSQGKSDTNLGVLGEDLVAQWLQTQQWQVLARQWHCRWGELDLVVQPDPATLSHQSCPTALVFVEVKTRSRGNWDANGLLSITRQKQAKLWKAAQLFLVKHPTLENCACRFDVALVCHRSHHLSNAKALYSTRTATGQWLILQDYIQDAFSL